jgi:hypothetical protein
MAETVMAASLPPHKSRSFAQRSRARGEARKPSRRRGTEKQAKGDTGERERQAPPCGVAAAAAAAAAKKKAKVCKMLLDS